MTNYDAIIIGTGQAGPSLARRLAGSGMKVAIVERDRFGGTCVNTGCTPTKTLVASAYAVHTARRGADFPAQLQAMLRAQGHNVRVANAGINGDTTAGMARRLDAAVNARTQVVILQPGGNDRRKGSGAERGDNVAAIVGRLNARGIKVIMLESVLRGVPAQLRQPDGTHLTPEGYRALAAQLLPQVTAAIGGR